MNNYAVETRERGKTLLIVEGNHEKNKLFWLIFKCFPEIKIDMENVWIYGTNIYLLYEDIVKQYGSNWAEEEIDIDLPFVISKKQTSNNLQHKNDFTNIFLVFDYERHDVNFSEDKILDMQNYFSDATNMGKLYINYPMIESYQHLKAIPDLEYSERKIPVSLQPGKKYKELVDSETVIGSIVDFPHRIDDLLEQNFGIKDTETRLRCCNAILSLSNEVQIEEGLQSILKTVIQDKRLSTLKYQLKDWILKRGYIQMNESYWQFARNLLKEITYHNICKANRIQNNLYEISDEKYRDCFRELDLVDILTRQNALSQNVVSGYIWVLNTCIFLVADYKFDLVQK